MTDYVWKLCNITFESLVLPGDWKTTVIVLLYKGEEEYKMYMGVRLINVLKKYL